MNLRMRRIMQLAGMLQVFLHMLPLRASEDILFSNPSPSTVEAKAETPWARFGGGASAALSEGDGELLWKTEAQNMILNYFTLGEPVALNPGESLVFTFKFRPAGLNPAERGFQIGIFNSAGEKIDGDRVASVIDPKFQFYSGYIAALDLRGSSTRGAFLYRRKAESGANDSNNLFGLSTTNVTFLKGGSGTSASEDTLIDGSLVIENEQSGMRVTLSLDGGTIVASDPNVISAFDTIAFISYGGNTKSITFAQCEVKIVR